MDGQRQATVPGRIPSDAKIKGIRTHVRGYVRRDDRKAWRTLAATLLAQVIAIALYAVGWWPVAMLLWAGLIVRTFVIYHDAVHRTFFKSQRWNSRLADVLQLVVLTPHGMWRANHLAHHARYGDLGFHDVADTIFFTKQQFEAMPALKRRLWRVARSPLVFFTFLPVAQWFIEYPLLRGNPWIWAGVVLNGAIIWKLSVWHLGAMYLGGMLGLILFHLQHAIVPGYRVPTGSWRFEHAALLGSTWLPVPPVLRWFTLGIEFHHVHHLQPGVPCYAMARCHREAPRGAWTEVTVGTWRNILQAMTNVMWDTERGRPVPFGR